MTRSNEQRGGFVLGLVAGLLVGLSLALGVALYITRAPVPFVNKVPARTPEQDQAEIERNKTWDPNAPLAGKAGKIVAPPASAPASAVAAAATAASAPAPAQPAEPARPQRDPAAILAGATAASTARGPDPFLYFVQAGAYTRVEEAEQQRARLAMLGQPAKISEREQQGRTVYRVRLGPFDTRNDADGLLAKLQESSIEGQIVRVEKP